MSFFFGAANLHHLKTLKYKLAIYTTSILQKKKNPFIITQTNFKYKDSFVNFL